MCGYTDVFEREDGFFQCKVCRKIMSQEWTVQMSDAVQRGELPGPGRIPADINEVR